MTRGDKFNRLTAVRHVFTDRTGAVWRFRCDCGTEKDIRAYRVAKGQTKSCGCIVKEFPNQKTHGQTKTAEYQAWRNMRRRCENPTDQNFPRYGARGITVCPEWSTSFEAFLRDMGPRPTPQHSLDRRDNEGPYEPGNCRWATDQEQSRNRRSNHVVDVAGERLPIVVVAERYGLSFTTVSNRLKRGWSVARIISTPERKYPRAVPAKLKGGTAWPPPSS